MNKNIIQKKMMNSIHLTETVDGVAEKSINSNLRDYQIFGNTVQDGVNLFDLNKIKMTDTTTNGVSISIVDGAVHIEGTPTKITTFLSVQANTSPILFKKGVYKIIVQGHLGLNFYTVENNTLKQVQKASTVDTYTFTLDEDYYLRQWYIWFNSASVGVEYNYTTIPTITKNLDLTEEVLYTSVSPDNPVEVVSVGELVTEGENVGKYKIPVVASGNLIKPITEERTGTINGITYTIKTDGSIILNGTATAGTTFYKSASYGSNNSFKLFKNERIVGDVYYSGSCKKETGEKGMGVAFKIRIKELDSNTLVEKKIVNNFNSLGSLNINTTSEIYDYQIYFYQGVYENFVIKPLVVRGLTAPDEFIPYVSVPKTNYIYLSEPLRKIGEHQDYIDFRNQKVYRNVRELSLTGNEIFLKTATGNSSPLYRFQMTDEQLAPSNLSDWTTQKCNYFIGANPTTTNTDVGISVYYSSSNSCTYCRVRDNDNFPYVNDFRAFLKEKYAEGNPLVVCYQSYDTIEEDIELPKLPQFKGTTIYSIPTTVQGEFVGTYKTRL